MAALEITYRFDPEALDGLGITDVDRLRTTPITDITVDETPFAALTVDETEKLAYATALASDDLARVRSPRQERTWECGRITVHRDPATASAYVIKTTKRSIEADARLLEDLAERLHADVYCNGPVKRLVDAWRTRHTSQAAIAERMLGADVTVDRYSPSTSATATFEVDKLPGMEVDQDYGTISADLTVEDCDRIIRIMESLRDALLCAERGN